jgi:arsenate reductase
MTAHWGIPDPAAVRGTIEEVQLAYREAFLLLEKWIDLLLSLPLPTMTDKAIKQEIDKIGQR